MLPFLYFCSMQSNQEKLVAHYVELLGLNSRSVSSEIYDKLISIQAELISIEDVITYISKIGQVLNTEDSDVADKTAELIEKIEDETNILIHKLKFISSTDRPKVLALDQVHPLKINDSPFLQESIKIAGGIPVLDGGEADKIILIDSSADAFTTVPRLLDHPAIASSKAIELDQIFIMTKPQFSHIPGYDYLTELESLAEIFQPKYFVYGHEGNDWLQFQLK